MKNKKKLNIDFLNQYDKQATTDFDLKKID